MERRKLFISYSHQDSRWLERLRVHLRPLERVYGLEIWDDRAIRPGSNWQEEIESALFSARVAILLVSADFIASDFITTNELPKLLSAAEHEGIVILPLILSPSMFSSIKGLSHFQAINDPAYPLEKLSRVEQEAVFVRLARSVEAILEGHQSNKGDTAGKRQFHVYSFDESTSPELLLEVPVSKAGGRDLSEPDALQASATIPKALNRSAQGTNVLNLNTAAIDPKPHRSSIFNPLFLRQRISLLLFGYIAVGKTSLWIRIQNPEIDRDYISNIVPSHLTTIEASLKPFPMGRYEVLPTYIDTPGSNPGLQLTQLLNTKNSIWLLVLAPTPLKSSSGNHNSVDREYIAQQLGHLSLPLGILGSPKLPKPKMVIVIISKIDLFCETLSDDESTSAKEYLAPLFVIHIERIREACLNAGVFFRLEFCSALKGWRTEAVHRHITQALFAV